MNWKLAGVAVALVSLVAVAILLIAIRINSGIGSADTLSRLAVNALITGSVHDECGEYYIQQPCSAFVLIRRALGFHPPVQGPVAVGNALTIHLALERIQLLPVVPRTNDAKPENSLLVRVSNKKMWLDFVGKNRAGRELKVSIELDSAGGTPVKLVANVGTDTREVTLLGTPKTANDKKLVYLVPEPGGSNPKFANWLGMPNEALPKTYAMLANNMRNVDPEFIPQIAQIIFNSIAAGGVEDTIGLYPALRNIDRHAAALRAMNADQWLPQEQIVAMTNAAYPEAPAARASWMLAMCESAGKPPVIDENCWYQLSRDDAAVNTLLSDEVVRLQALYSPLETGHPLRLRLDRLSEALHKTALRKAAIANIPVSGS